MHIQKQNFISLLGYGIGAMNALQIEDPSYSEILQLAESHGVIGLMYPGFKKLLPTGHPIVVGLKKRSFATATRDSLREKELAQIYAACNEAKIPILPLKGCVIKSLYPNPELRYMSDADLLIREEDRDKMQKIMKALGHRSQKVDTGDTDVYVSSMNLAYEIHLSLEAEGFSPESRAFTAELLCRGKAVRDGEFLMELAPEEHYVYLLCHFIKHFIHGGVGVRQLCDLYICYSRWPMDRQRLTALLDTLELREFQRTLMSLWEHWFSHGPGSDITEELGTYILGSGVFGNEEQRSTDRLLEEKDEKRYLFARLFPPYRIMKGYFPILKKIPVLLPLMWIWRMLRAVLFRRRKLAMELKAYSTTDQEALDSRRRFYRQCGLSVYQD